MSSSTTQATATQKLLEHIRRTPSPGEAPRSPSKLRMPPTARRSLFGRERAIVGVEVGNGWISLAQRSAGNAPLLEAVRTVPIPDGMDWDTPGCADKVREALDGFLPDGGRESDIWVRLPDGQDELRHYRIPKVSPKDRDVVAKMTASREKAFDESQNLFDYRVEGEVLDKGVPRLPVTAMIANKDAVARLKRTLASAGIEPAGITSASIYPQNLFASGWLTCPWDHFAFADIGEDSTRIEMFSGSAIALSRTIKTGLRSLITALQETHQPGSSPAAPSAPGAPAPVSMPTHLPMDTFGELRGSPPTQPPVSSFASDTDAFPLILQPETAQRDIPLPQLPLMDAAPAYAVPDESLSYEEGLRLLYDAHRTPEEEEALLLRLSQPLGRLARQLERTADHFRNAMGMPNIQGVIVFAPGGCLSLALRKFETILGLPCHPLRFDGQTSPGGMTDLEQALSGGTDTGLTQAIGLCLSSPRYTPNAVMTYRDQQLRERQMRISFLSFGVTTVVLMLLLAFCGKLYVNYLDDRKTRAKLEERVASWRTIYTPDQLRENLAATQKLQTQARQLARRRTAAALMAELSAITPDAIHLTGMRVTFKDVKPGKPDARPAQRGNARAQQGPEESAVAIITGTVTGDMLQRESRLAEFLSHLEHSPMVLSLLVEKQQTDTDVLSFVATLRLV